MRSIGPQPAKVRPVALHAVGDPFLVVKIGGSLFSDKAGDERHFDDDAVAGYARLVAELGAAKPGRVALIVGGGAYGHGAGRALDPSDPLSGVLLTEANFTLKWRWTQALRAEGARAVPLQLEAMCAIGADGLLVEGEVLRRFLRIGALPVLSGDSLLGPNGSMVVYSSDLVPEVLMAACSGPIRIVNLTDVPGILVDGRDGHTVLRHVDPDEPDEAYGALWESPPWDISRSMHGKLDALVEFARGGADCFIMKGDARAASARFMLDPVEGWPPDVAYTRIVRSEVRQLAAARG